MLTLKNIEKQKSEIIESDSFSEALSKFIDYNKQPWTSQLPIFYLDFKIVYTDSNNIDCSKFQEYTNNINLTD